VKRPKRAILESPVLHGVRYSSAAGLPDLRIAVQVVAGNDEQLVDGLSNDKGTGEAVHERSSQAAMNARV